MNEKKKGRREAESQSALQRWMAERREQINNMTRGQRIRRRILQGAVVVSVVIIVIWAILTMWIQPPEVPEIPGGSSAPSASASTSGSMTEDWDTEIPDIAKSGRKEGVYTFLVAGLDVASGATDTMLLLSYDINAKTVHGLNLPRDTITNVSYNSKRLNTIYTINKGSDKATQAEKGMDALGKHVAKLTGITPDYYVILEWEAIGELVEALGGVEFNIPFDMNYDDPYQDPPLHIHQQAGVKTLNGDDAMQVIRWRKNNDGSNPQGDVGRLAIQQDFLKAVVKKCLQPSVVLKIPALAEIFMDNVRTDLSIGNILAFAKAAIGMDPANGVVFQTAPLAADAWYNGAAMVTLDGEGILEIVNGGMNPYLRDIEASDLELIYKKSDGSYGVTKGELADPAMGVVKLPEPEPEEPEQPQEPLEEPVQDPSEPGVELPSDSNEEVPDDPSLSQPQEGEEGVLPPEQDEVEAGDEVQTGDTQETQVPDGSSSDGQTPVESEPPAVEEEPVEENLGYEEILPEGMDSVSP